MKNKVNVLVDKLNELYRVYEEQCWQDNNLEILVLIDNMAITFYLNDKSHSKDMFCLTFNRSEKKLYKYITLNLFNLFLGDVYIYKDNETFYNQKHKPYLKIVVSEEDILVLINDLVFNQDNVYIQEGISNIYGKAPFKIYSKNFIKQLDERIDFSKRKLRSEKK